MGATVTNINRLFYLVSIYVILTFFWRFCYLRTRSQSPIR